MTELKFEERICKHPKCQAKFKALKASKQKYHSEHCRVTDDLKSKKEMLEKMGLLRRKNR